MLAATFALGTPVSAQVQDCGDRVVVLSEGFNLVGVVEARPADALGAQAVFGWEAAWQAFVSWRAGAPASLNGLDELAAGGGAWVEVGPGGGSVALPGGTGESRSVALVGGWNLVTWTGPSETGAGAAFAAATPIPTARRCWQR